MTLKLMMLSTGAALLISPMWAQEPEKKATTTTTTTTETQSTTTATPSQSTATPSEATPSEATPTTAQSQDSSMKTWTGTLFDADCKSATPTEKCDVTSTTKTFGFMSADGKNYKLDSDSSTKVRTAMQAHKEQARTSGAPSTSSTELKASVTGTMDGDTIKVDSIQIL